MPAVEYIDVPDQAAIDFLIRKLSVTTRAWDDIKKEAHAKAFTVAGATKLDLLNDIREAVEKGLTEGESLGAFRKRFAEIVNKHGWEYNGKFGWRTDIIFNTNMRTAHMAGRWDKLQQNKKNRPFLMYRTAGDSRVRDEHKAWDRIILPIDHPFWKTHFPPNGWGCRCGVRTVSQRDLDKKGWKVTDQKTVDAYLADVKENGDGYNGIDDGWDYNVGIAWKNKDKASIKAFSTDIQKQFNQGLKEYKNTLKVAPSALSTLSGVGASEINQVLRGLDQAKDQLNKLSEFAKEKGIKTLFLKQSELGANNKAASAVVGKVNEYLGSTLGLYNYGHRRASRTNGFTSASFNHVVVKAATKHRIKKDNIDNIVQDINNAVASVIESGEAWSVSSSTTLDAAQLIITWAHEIGHQVHYWAGSPKAPSKAVKLTQYSHQNNYEYHAEHFVLWLLARDKLDKKTANYFDELIDSAIKGKIKKR